MDVIIVGGGIVGLTMANLLAQIAELRITVVESQIPVSDWDNTYYDLRCSAIARASLNIFKYIDVWPAIVAERLGVYDKMQIWQTGHTDSIKLAAVDVAATELGHIVENRVLQRALRSKLATYNTVKLCKGVAHKLEQVADLKRLYIDDYHIDAHLVIGADGADSWLRRAAHIETYGWDYQQCALVATIKSALPHMHTAMQSFAADGTLAFLPLDKTNLSSIVWSSTPAKIKQLMQLVPEEFCAALAAEFCNKLGSLEVIGERASFPLRMLHARTYIAQRVALIGDAAHVIHPLAGQGLNLGIMDAAVLAESVSIAVRSKIDIGRTSVLRSYERRRKSHNLSMIAIVEGFKRSYGLLTGINNQIANNFKLASNYAIRFAMGITGDLPESAFNVNKVRG